MRVARILPIVVLAAVAPPGPASASPSQRLAYESQVVSIVVTVQGFEPWRPWEKKTPDTRTVQAVVVDGHGLVTTADNIENATILMVEKHGRPLRETARIVQVDGDANLALLTVDTPGYFDDLKPITLATTTPTEGQVESIRWREGQLEVAASRINRIEVGLAYLGALRHASLKMETDMSVGGWSEPVFAKGQLVGLTYSQEAQRATVTPVDIVRGWLAAARAPGPYKGLANFDVSWQANRDPALARSLSQQGEPQGVLVTEVPWGSSACGALFPRDILLSLDGHAIDAAGYYQHPVFGLVEFTQIAVDGHRAGDVVPAEVLRAGKRQKVQITLRAARAAEEMLPTRSAGEAPPYAVEGGLVFRELDGDFLRSWGKDWDKKAPLLLMTRYELFQSTQTPARRRTILLAYVLPSRYNVGYSDLESIPVARINGRTIGSIDDVVEAFQHPEGEFHRVELEANFARSEIVLDAATLETATSEILARYKIGQRARKREQLLPDLGDSCPDHP